MKHYRRANRVQTMTGKRPRKKGKRLWMALQHRCNRMHP
jgi:hypothetical protein